MRGAAAPAPRAPHSAPTSRSASTAHLAPDSHPAHALLSVAHALLCPANKIATAAPEKVSNMNVLPIEQVAMPTEDVSDLREVVDAINRLCDNMKNSYDVNDDDPEVIVEDVNLELVNPSEVVVRKVETHVAENWIDPIVEDIETVILENTETVILKDTETVVLKGTETVVLKDTETIVLKDTETVVLKDAEAVVLADTVNFILEDSHNVILENTETMVFEDTETLILEDTEVMLDAETVSDMEQTLAPCEPISEMYYTASSEVSLLSETDIADKLQSEDSDKEKDVRNSVIAGHVAAMRERFESMTRANTPCPDLIRSLSPSLDMFRNITPSPDFLDKS